MVGAGVAITAEARAETEVSRLTFQGDGRSSHPASNGKAVEIVIDLGMETFRCPFLDPR